MNLRLLLLLLLHILLLLLLLLYCFSFGLVHPTAIQDSRPAPLQAAIPVKPGPISDGPHSKFEKKSYLRPTENRLQRSKGLCDWSKHRPRGPTARQTSLTAIPSPSASVARAEEMDKRVIRGECTSLPHQLESKKPRLENPTPGANG